MATTRSVLGDNVGLRATFSLSFAGIPVKPVESDPHRLCQRQKQIDYGKNTLGYERYTEMVPR